VPSKGSSEMKGCKTACTTMPSCQPASASERLNLRLPSVIHKRVFSTASWINALLSCIFELYSACWVYR
jgi:hypothetical protein